MSVAQLIGRGIRRNDGPFILAKDDLIQALLGTCTHHRHHTDCAILSVVVVESEKDCETLRRIGLTATTNAGGAGKWHDEFSQYFNGKRVAIIADNDEPGRNHADKVARSVLAFAEQIKLIDLPDVPEKGDVSDYLQRHSKDELLELIKAAKPFTTDQKIDAPEPLIPTMDEIKPERVFWLWLNRIPIGRLTLFDGDPGTGKSWLALAIASAVSRGDPLPFDSKRTSPAHILLMSCEDGYSDTVSRDSISLEPMFRGSLYPTRPETLRLRC